MVQLLTTVNQLLQPELDQHNIAPAVTANPASIVLQADKGLIEQVLINLIKNAIDAVAEQPQPFIIITITGLSLSKKIIQLHGGELRVKSSSAGTSFSIGLPK